MFAAIILYAHFIAVSDTRFDTVEECNSFVSELVKQPREGYSYQGELPEAATCVDDARLKQIESRNRGTEI